MLPAKVEAVSVSHDAPPARTRRGAKIGKLVRQQWAAAHLAGHIEFRQVLTAPPSISGPVQESISKDRSG